MAGIGYDKLANTFLEYENTKIHKTLILLVAPSANINILDLPPLAGQFYLLSVNTVSLFFQQSREAVKLVLELLVSV